jgi:preprotein translocase subunit SecF
MEKKTGITFTPWETDEGTVLLLFLYIFDVFVYTLQKLSRTNFVNVISICKDVYTCIYINEPMFWKATNAEA